MSQVLEPKRIKLRRINNNNNKEDIIEKNLKPLKENIKKKKRAQAAYYENHNESGLSPLIRDFGRRPVHQRLGRKLPFMLGTNTSSVLPKRRLRQPGNQFNRRTGIFTAQQRLNFIRAKNREGLNTASPKRIKLRRAMPLGVSGPTNLTVEVKNSAFRPKNHFGGCFCRFRQTLNPQLQLEIKEVQMKFQGGQMIWPVQFTPAATEKPLNKRFSELI